MSPEEVWEWVQRQQEKGAPEEWINQHIAQETDYPNVFALRMAIESSEDFIEAEERQGMGGLVRNVGESLLQGFTGSAADDALMQFPASVPGGRAVRAAGRGIERRQQDRSRHEPGATAAAEIGGAMALPMGLLNMPKAAAAARGATHVSGRGIIPSMIRGGLKGSVGGAAGGGTVGFFSSPSDAPPEERVESARRGALIGGGTGLLTGGLMGTFAGALGGRAGRPGRLADSFVERTGREIEDASLTNQLAKIEDVQTQVQDELYKPLERMFPRVEDMRVRSVLEQVNENSAVRNNVLTGQQGLDRLREPGAIPSFKDLQRMRANLLKMGKRGNDDAMGLYTELTGALDETLGPDFALANDWWRRSLRAEEAVNMGWDMWDEPVEKLIQNTQDMAGDPFVEESFARGVLSRWRSQFSRSPDDTLKRLENLVTDLDDTSTAGVGADRRAALGRLFGGQDTQDFKDFLRIADTELSAERRREMLERILQSTTVAMVTGAAAGALAGRGGGGGGGN